MHKYDVILRRPSETHWDIVRRLAAAIAGTHHITYDLFQVVVELRDYLNAWIEQMEANNGWRQ